MRTTLFLLLLFSVPALADTVVLREGGRIEGEVVDLGDRIQVKTRMGAVTLLRSEVREIVPHPPARQVYQERRKALAPGDVSGRLALAEFCFENDLTEEWGALLQEVLRLDPANTPAQERHYQYRKLYEPLPRSKSAENKLRFELGAGFQLLYGDHYLVCHAGQAEFAAERLRQFELHYRNFYRFFEDRGFRLELLDRRLEAVLFGTQEDYAAFTRKHAPGLEGGAGYYSTATHRLYFFDARNGEKRARAERELEAARGGLRALRGEIEAAGNSRNRKRASALYARYDDEFEACARARWEWRTYFDEANEATTLHEATHQLCHESGLLRANPNQPTWLVEGIALFFEDPEQFYAAGTRVNSIDRDRIEDLQEALRQGRLIPLRTLLGLRGSFFELGERRVHLAYAESWALVRFLIKGPDRELHNRFFKYLRQQGMIPAGEPVSEERMAGDFLAALARELPALERAWLDFIRALPPPE